MMLMVIDSSVIVKWFFLESLTQEALAIRQDWLTYKVDLIAPELILAEVGNIVWKKHRLGLITEQEGIDILSDLLALNLLTVSTEILLPIAYNLATEFDRTVYDSLYLGLAQSRGVKFITADLRLYNSVHSKLNFVEYLGNYQLP